MQVSSAQNLVLSCMWYPLIYSIGDILAIENLQITSNNCQYKKKYDNACTIQSQNVPKNHIQRPTKHPASWISFFACSICPFVPSILILKVWIWIQPSQRILCEVQIARTGVENKIKIDDSWWFIVIFDQEHRKLCTNSPQSLRSRNQVILLWDVQETMMSPLPSNTSMTRLHPFYRSRTQIR